MKSDLGSTVFAALRRFSAVLLQQGRVQVDADAPDAPPGEGTRRPTPPVPATGSATATPRKPD